MPSRGPARRSGRAAGQPATRRAGVEESTGRRGSVGRSARGVAGRSSRWPPATRPRSGSGSGAGRRATSTSIPGAIVADPARERLGLGEVGAVAVEQRHSSSPARASRPRPAPPSRGRRRRRQAVVRVEHDRLAVLDLPAADRRVADGVGDLERLDAAAGLGHVGGVGRGRRASGRAPAARRSPRRRCASARRRPAGRPARRPGAPPGPRSDCSAGRGPRRASTASIASSSSPVLGLADWPPSTTAATPKSRKIAASPSPAATATTADAPEAPVEARRRPVSRSAGRRPCAASRRPTAPGEFGGPGLADVARLVVEVLDADPAQRAEARP